MTIKELKNELRILEGIDKAKRGLNIREYIRYRKIGNEIKKRVNLCR